MARKRSPVEKTAFAPERETAARLLCKLVDMPYSTEYARCLAEFVEREDWALISLNTRKKVLARLSTVRALVEVMLE